MDPKAQGSAGLADVKHESSGAQTAPRTKQRSRGKNTAEAEGDDAKRRCVSSACVACRKRKSKCDGNLPACAACSQVYGTECIYDPNSDHRRKGVYKNDIDSLKTRNSTLATLIQAILNASEDDVLPLVQEIRTCDSLDAMAEKLSLKQHGMDVEDDEDGEEAEANGMPVALTFENQLYGKMGDLRLDEGSVRYIGGTSNLIHLAQEDSNEEFDEYQQQENPITSWTDVTDDPELVVHLLNMYFTWHYTFFTTLSKTLFYRDFLLGKPPASAKRKTHYCTPLLVNAILALGCHFTSHTGGRENPEDSATAGDHFFREAKRLIMADDLHEQPRLANVQALALMSVREAGCGREAKGWVYSGMSFRMCLDMGLNLDSGRLTTNKAINGDEAEEDVRRISFWGCFLFDKCWSNYLGRLPQLPTNIVTVPKVEVFPDEDASSWQPYSDSGWTAANAQPARTRAVALQITKLCEISNDIMKDFYNPTDMEKAKGKASELKKLSDIHVRLEAWRRDLPKEFEPKEGGLSSVLTMHMFFQLLFIHLFRPFLKYTRANSPLPSNVSPRKLCSQAASMISKLMRLYKRSHGLRQICNIVVYITHSACTIHLLNLPAIDKNARRDLTHGVKHLEEIAEGWLGARRSLSILSLLARKWNVELPDEAQAVLARTENKFGSYTGDVQSPSAPRRPSQQVMNPSQFDAQAAWQNPSTNPTTTSYFNNATMPTANVGAPSATTGVGAAVRAHSGNYQLPPDDHNGLQAQQYPSAAATPASTNNQGHRNHSSVNSTGSPSDMFGGITQLLRDSQDWVYRDQAQFATGFENWDNVDMNPSLWTNGGAVEGRANAPNGMVNGDIGTSMPAGTMASTMPMSNTTAPPFAALNGTSNQSFPPDSWLVGLSGFNQIALYNEDEWYN